jgi:ribosome-associated toxin RatA of RatAB toxin-antitoxin module
LNWEMRSRPLQKAIDMLLPSVARMMVEAFQTRAAGSLNLT